MRLLTKSSSTATLSLNWAPAWFSTIMATLRSGAELFVSVANKFPAESKPAAKKNWENSRINFFAVGKLNHWPGAFVLVIEAAGTGALVIGGGAGFPLGAGMCAGRPY